MRSLTIAASAKQQRAENKLYRCTSVFSALDHCGKILLKSFCCIYTKLGAQSFSPIFGVFSIFDRNFANIVAPSGDGSGQPIVHLKAQSFVKNGENSIKIDTINHDTILVQTMSPRAGRPSVTNKKHHIFAPTAGARSSISPKLCTAIEDVVPILEGINHFSIQRIVFLHGRKC